MPKEGKSLAVVPRHMEILRKHALYKMQSRQIAEIMGLDEVTVCHVIQDEENQLLIKGLIADDLGYDKEESRRQKRIASTVLREIEKKVEENVEKKKFDENFMFRTLKAVGGEAATKEHLVVEGQGLFTAEGLRKAKEAADAGSS